MAILCGLGNLWSNLSLEMMKIKKAPSQFVVFLLGSYSTLYTLIQCLQLVSLFTNTCNLGAPENWCFWTMVLEKNLESPLDCKEIQPIHPKDRSWVFIGRTDVKAETPVLWSLDSKLTHMKRPWCREKLRAEGDNRGWDGWMASLTQWTWVWVDPGSWWWTGRPGVLRFMGSESDTTEWLNWTVALDKQPLQCLDFLICKMSISRV